MAGDRRPKRIASLLTEALGRIFIEDVQGGVPGLVTVTRVEMSADLMTARVVLSVFGAPDPAAILELLEMRKGHIRKTLASRINLRYNPQLIFELDPSPEYEERLDRLLESTKKHGT
jgi:ribosome-binding factor A